MGWKGPLFKLITDVVIPKVTKSPLLSFFIDVDS